MNLLQRYFLVFCLLVFTTTWLVAQSTYYVSPTGDDTTGTGSIDLPYKTISQAISVAVAGDTIYLRGGRHFYNAKISLSKVGTSTNRWLLVAYPGDIERPILDFSAMVVNSSNRGVSISGQYWHIKGLDIYKAGDNGMIVSGSNNIIEFCSFYENYDTGLQLDNGASNNQIINCDSYYNCDPGQGNADGFSPKLSVGTGNYFYGCRSWQNSDDGFDGYLRPANDIATTYENCWCFMNGYLKNGTKGSGNGNGFKTGGSDGKDLKHNAILKNCLAFDNKVKGFDQNNNRGSITLYNCTAYRNGTYNFSVPDTLAVSAGKILTVKNCISLGSPSGITLRNPILANNSWPDTPPYISTARVADFMSVDTAGVRGPRNADGSLPYIQFMRLAQGSPFVNAGTDVGLPFFGSAPDLGAFEDTSAPITITLSSFLATHIGGTLVQLEWTTLGENNNDGFYVQRLGATDLQWSDLPNSYVPGHDSTIQTYQYAFIDSSIRIGSWFYRLKQVEVGGAIHFTYAVQVNVLTGVEESVTRITSFQLLHNYPNPFNPTTTIPFTVEKKGLVRVTVYNVLGQEIVTLFSGQAEPGKMYSIPFHAESLPSGVYFSVLESGGKRQIKKMVLMK